MNILIVDDQISVLNGLVTSVDFAKLGYEKVFTATDSEAALAILEKEQVHVLMSDIEMPGRNGLELNSIVRDRYPEILRILLTSHTNFSYAKEGLKLGCFDYLVQPAPYPEIEASLTRAAVQYQTNQHAKTMSTLGSYFDRHRTELLNSSILNLFSKDSAKVDEGINLVHEAGFLLDRDSYVKLVLLDIFDYSAHSSDAASMHEVIMTIKSLLSKLDLPEGTGFLIAKNTYDLFVVLFFSRDNIYLSTQLLENMYSLVKASVKSEIACYIAWTTLIDGLRECVTRLHGEYKNNITKSPQLVYVHKEDEPELIPTSLEGFLDRWDKLIQTRQRALLTRDIMSYLDRNLSNSTNGFYDLCELHQRLTQLFFKYYYENNIDIVSLFNADMSYEKYMYSYNSIDSMKESVLFLISAMDQGKKEYSELNYVERAKNFILENSDKCLTVREVAGYINLNPEYFTRLFKKETGYNIKDYIIDCKLTAAKDLLLNSDLPVSMVALELGYSNFSHFTQMFKRSEGITPKEYRSKHRGGSSD